MGLFGNRRTIFDLIREADEDENQTSDSAAEDSSTPETPPADNSTEDNEAEPSEDTGDGDDFSIDTELGDEESEGEEGGGDTDSGDESSSSDIGGGSTTGEGEPVKANTDIFASLTAEEQVVKIKELKNLFSKLYTSCDDLLAKVNEINTNEFTLDPVSRVSNTLYNLKQYISDYITNIFPNRSYIENDIAFNRFLTILDATTNVFEDLMKENEKKSS